MRRVKTWTKIAGGGLVVMLIGVALRACLPSKGPVYKGKGVREYMYSLGPDPDREEAFKYFGTNAIPYIRAGLRARDTLGQKALLWANVRAPWLKIRVMPAWASRTVALRSYHQILIADDWGDARAACAPEIRALANDPEPSFSRAGKVLAEINTRGINQFP